MSNFQSVDFKKWNLDEQKEINIINIKEDSQSYLNKTIIMRCMWLSIFCKK